MTKCQAEFEKWVKKNKYHLSAHHFDLLAFPYGDVFTAHAFNGWCAAWEAATNNAVIACGAAASKAKGKKDV